jgi:hypothetical protein
MNLPEVESSSVVLRGQPVSVASDIGRSFVGDCARYIEGLISEPDIKIKWGLTTQQWQAFERDTPLLKAVQRERGRRVMSGAAAAEAARQQFVKAPSVLGSILLNDEVSPRHRIEAARELRAITTTDSTHDQSSEDKFVVVINLGAGEKRVYHLDHTNAGASEERE